jgi:hypothetical protein
MQQKQTDKNEGFKGGRYARTEDELYEKAIALLEKCKIEPPGSSREMAAEAHSA